MATEIVRPLADHRNRHLPTLPDDCFVQEPPSPVSRVVVQLHDDEWGNEIMYRAACEVARSRDNMTPLVVTVWEHAGWEMSFLFHADGIEDGVCVGSANGSGQCSPIVREFFRNRQINTVGRVERGKPHMEENGVEVLR